MRFSCWVLPLCGLLSWPVCGAAAPPAIWSIGKPDLASDEFGASPKPGVFRPGVSDVHDWPRTQAAGREPASIAFPLAAIPASPPVLAVDLFFITAAPEALSLDVNGHRGRFFVRPEAAPDLDERTAYMPLYSRHRFRLPLDPTFFRAGENRIAIAVEGESGGAEYDWVALLEGSEPLPKITAAIEATIFFRERGGHLYEVANMVVRSASPAAPLHARVQLGAEVFERDLHGARQEFGEFLAEIEVPAPSAPRPYVLTLRTGAGERVFRADFTPAKRWRLFAGLKIHNDIGFTDLQQNIHTLDVRNIDGALALLGRYPFYKFNLEDSWLAENYLSSRTGPRRAQFLDSVAAGRLGVSAFYLNLMTGLCTGEELHRALYFSKELERKYGSGMRFAAITDAPSHSWFLPTLLADAGVKGFAVGSNQFRAPILQLSALNENSPFYWEGPDGARLMAWFARNYQGLFRLTGPNPTSAHLRRTITQFLARWNRPGYAPDAVLVYGMSTDNAEIRSGEAEAIRQWNAAYAFPKIIPATDDEYFSYVSRNFAERLPVYRGDGGAYWEDGAASDAAQTARNRETQRNLPLAEFAASLASVLDPDLRYPADEFREAWKNLLFFDEHTWGSHYAATQPERETVRRQWDYKRGYGDRASWLAGDLLTRSLSHIASQISIEGPTLFVFNPDVAARTDVVETELAPAQQLVDLSTSATVPVEVCSTHEGFRRVRMLARDVPPLGYKAYAVKAAGTQPAQTRGSGWEIESRYYRVKVDPATGAIASLVDKQLNRDLVDHDCPWKLNQLLYVSGGDKSRIIENAANLPEANLTVSAQGGAELAEVVRSPLGPRLQLRARAPHVPVIDTEIALYEDLKRVDIVNHLRKEDVRDKEAVYFAFPFRLRPPEFLYQIQNALVRPNADQLPGAAREWFATQNLIVARDSDAAIAWASPDAPLVTLTDINRGRWPKELPVNNGYVFSYVMNNYWFTNYRASQAGDTTFRYFLTSAASLDEAQLARFDAATRSPLVAHDYHDKLHIRLEPAVRRLPAAQASFLEVDSPSAQMAAFKPGEDGQGYIVRLLEMGGRRGVALLRSSVFEIQAATLANGMEDDRQPLAVRGGVVEIPMAPHRFTTVRLRFGP